MSVVTVLLNMECFVFSVKGLTSHRDPPCFLGFYLDYVNSYLEIVSPASVVKQALVFIETYLDLYIFLVF